MEKDHLMVKSVEKAFSVLNAFGKGRSLLSIAAIADITGMDKSAVQRFCHSLCKIGYLEKCPTTRHFRLCSKVLELGAFYIRANPLVRAATPYLMKISQETNEAVSLTVLDGTHIVYLQRFLSRNILSSGVVAGTRLPAFCTAPGMAILSGLPREEAVRIIESSEKVRFTSETETNTERLIERLETTARRGYAISDGQVYLNHITVAVPVFGPLNQAPSALSIGVNQVNCSLEEAEKRFVPILTAACGALSEVRTWEEPLTASAEMV